MDSFQIFANKMFNTSLLSIFITGQWVGIFPYIPVQPMRVKLLMSRANTQVSGREFQSDLIHLGNIIPTYLYFPRLDKKHQLEHHRFIKYWADINGKW